MDIRSLNNIIDSIFSLFPLFREKIFSDYKGKFVIKPSNLQFAILMILHKYNSLSVSKVGRKLCISKPNISPLLNNLIQEGIIRRTKDKRDKRITNIELTQKGKKILHNTKNTIRKNIEVKLRALDRQALELLEISLGNTRKIVSRLN